jgi:hypothetical protein
MFEVLEKPQNGCTTDETYRHFRSRIGSKALLERLQKHHGTEEVIVEAEPPEQLPPIPNETVAIAAEIAFPDWVNIVTKIKAAVCKEWGISAVDLVSQRRAPKYVLPRQVGIFLCRKITTRSLPEIARRFGGRDHSTAIHAVRKIEQRIETDAALRARIAMLADLFGGSIA